MNFNFKSFDNSKQNILLCDIDECYMIKKLKQTLTEIKEIAEKRNYLDYNECLDDILQIISEAINE